MAFGEGPRQQQSSANAAASRLKAEVGPRRRAETSQGNHPNRDFIVGAIIIFIAGVGTLVFVLIDSGKQRPRCEVIREALAKGASNSKRFGLAEMSECATQADCVFDVSTCDIPCPLGFETDENQCQISCQCSLNSHGTFQGDIQFEETETVGLLKRYGYLEKQSGFATYSSSVRESVVLWPRVEARVLIPYLLSDDLKTTEARKVFNDAFNFFTVNTCISFVPYIKNQGDNYLNISTRPTCGVRSQVGMAPQQPQSVIVSLKCLNQGLVMHLMMHVLGFEHEHVRPDRDGFITVNYDNILPHLQHHFEKIREPVMRLGRPYDFISLTQLSSYSFAEEGMSMTKKDGTAIVQRQLQHMSMEDAEEINILYGCKDSGGQVITGLHVLEPDVPDWTLGGNDTDSSNGDENGGTDDGDEGSPAEGDGNGSTGDAGGGGTPGNGDGGTSGNTGGGSTGGTPGDGGVGSEDGTSGNGNGGTSGNVGGGLTGGTPGNGSIGSEGGTPGNGSAGSEGGTPGNSSSGNEGGTSGNLGGGLSGGASGNGSDNGTSESTDKGQWGEWKSWSDCTETCGAGQAIRFRLCEHVNEINIACPGDWLDTKNCEKKSCPLELGTWNPWGEWTQCSATCNNGHRLRFRSCPFDGPPCAGLPATAMLCEDGEDCVKPRE